MKVLRRFRFLLVVLTGIALVAATVYTLRSNDDTRRTAGRLGPTRGSSESYVRTKSSYLTSVAKTNPGRKAAALVSLNRYIPASQVQAMTRAMKATAVIVRFPASDQELQFVRTTVTGALADRSTDLRHEIEAEIRALEDQAKQAKGKQKADLDALIAKRHTELAEVKADCACVFAFAVEDASLEALEALAKLPVVRLVDVPKPVTDDLAGWELGPIVPSPKPAAKPAATPANAGTETTKPVV